MTRRTSGMPPSRSRAESGRRGKNRSPWGKDPHCATPAAKISHIHYRQKGKPTP